MITTDKISQMARGLTDLYVRMETDLIVEIAKYFKVGEVYPDMIDWQASKMQQMGWLRQDAVKAISEVSGRALVEIENVLEAIGLEAIKDDDIRYKLAVRAGQQTAVAIPFEASSAMRNIMDGVIQNTKNYLNLTNTTALNATQSTYLNTVNQVYLETMTGMTSYDDAVRKATRRLADSGMDNLTASVRYGSGARAHIDVAVRRNIMTSSAQMVGKMQIQRAQEWGNNLVEVSSHADARPEHAEWQGKVYSLEGGTSEYPNLAAETGYGTGEGLMGYNCRHVFYPYFDGLSEQTYPHYNEDVDDENYEIAQEQRQLERDVRQWKRRELIADATQDDQEKEKASAKVKEKEDALKDFTKAHDIVNRRERTVVHGY